MIPDFCSISNRFWDKCKFKFFKIFRTFWKFSLILIFKNVLCCDHDHSQCTTSSFSNLRPFGSISNKHFLQRNGNIGFCLKFRTHYFEVLHNYEKTHLVSIGNIAAKFEESTPCSYRDMLRTKQWDTEPLPIAVYNNNPKICFL